MFLKDLIKSQGLPFTGEVRIDVLYQLQLVVLSEQISILITVRVVFNVLHFDRQMRVRRLFVDHFCPERVDA